MSGYPYDYYQVLGFERTSPSTNNEATAPLIYKREDKTYSLAQIDVDAIKAAYRKKALQLHPDKEQDLKEKAAKGAAFIQLAAAYQFLSKGEERLAFNEWLAANPESFAKKQSLILHTKAFSEGASADEKKKTQAVDLSYLYHQTPCPGLLKETAKANSDFARSVLEGSALRDSLDLEHFYTILLDLFEKQPNKTFISEMLYSKWLSSARLSNTNYGAALQMACLHYPNKAVPEQFIKLFSKECKALGLESLLLLAPDFFSAEEIIFQTYGSSLSLAQIEYLWASGKKENEKMCRAYYNGLPQAQRDKFKAAWQIKGLIADSKLRDNEKLKELFAVLGPDILELDKFLYYKVYPGKKATPLSDEKKDHQPKLRNSLAELFVLRHLLTQKGSLTSYLGRFPHSEYRKTPADFIAKLLGKLTALESEANFFSWLMRDKNNLPHLFESDPPVNAGSLLRFLNDFLTKTEFEALKEKTFKQLAEYPPAIAFFIEALLNSDKTSQERVLRICEANLALGKAVMAHALFKASASSEQPAQGVVALIAAYFSFHHLLSDEDFAAFREIKKVDANREQLQEEQDSEALAAEKKEIKEQDSSLLESLAVERKEILEIMSKTQHLVLQKPLMRKQITELFWKSLWKEKSCYVFDGEQLFWVWRMDYRIKWTPPLALNCQEFKEGGAIFLTSPQVTAQITTLNPELVTVLKKKIAAAETELAQSMGLSVETIRQVDAEQLRDKQPTEKKPLASALYPFIIKSEGSSEAPACSPETFATVYKQLRFLPWMVAVKLTIEDSTHRFLQFQQALQITSSQLRESLDQEYEISKSCDYVASSNLFSAWLESRFSGEEFLTLVRTSFLSDVLANDDKSLLGNFDAFLTKNPASAKILRKLFMQKFNKLTPEEQEHWFTHYERKLPGWSHIFIPGSCLTFPCPKRAAHKTFLAYLEDHELQPPDQSQLLALAKEAGADKATLATVAAKLQNFPASAYAFFLALAKTPFAALCEKPLQKLEQQFLADLESKAEKQGMLEIALLYIERHSKALAADPSLLYKLSAQFGKALEGQLAAYALKQQADSATLMAGFFTEVVNGATISLAEPQKNQDKAILQEITAFIASQSLVTLTANNGLQEKQWYKQMLLIDQQQAPEIGTMLRASSGGTRNFYQILLIMATHNQSAWAQAHLHAMFAQSKSANSIFSLDLSLLPASLDESGIRYLMENFIPLEAWLPFLTSSHQSIAPELLVKLLSELGKKCRIQNREVFSQILVKLQAERNEVYYAYALHYFLAQNSKPSLKELMTSFCEGQDKNKKLRFLQDFLAYAETNGIDLAIYNSEIYGLLLTLMIEKTSNLEAKVDDSYLLWAKQQEQRLRTQLLQQKQVDPSALKKYFVNQPLIAFTLDNITDDIERWELAQLMLPTNQVGQERSRWITDYFSQRFKAKPKLQSQYLCPLAGQGVEGENHQQFFSPQTSFLLSWLKQSLNTESFVAYSQGVKAAVNYLRTEERAEKTELGSLANLEAILHKLRFIFYWSEEALTANTNTLATTKIRQLMQPILQQAAQTPALLSNPQAFKDFIRKELKQSVYNELLALSQTKAVNRYEDDIYLRRALALFGFILSLALLGLPLFADAYRRVFFYTSDYKQIARELDKLAPEPRRPWKWLWRFLGMVLIGGGLIISVLFLGVWPLLLSLGLGPAVTGFSLAVGSLMTAVAVLAALELTLLSDVSFNRQQIKQQLLVFSSCLSATILAPVLALVIGGITTPLVLYLLLGAGALGAGALLLLFFSVIKYRKGSRARKLALPPSLAANKLSEDRQPLLTPEVNSSSAASSYTFSRRNSIYGGLPTTEPSQDPAHAPRRPRASA